MKGEVDVISDSSNLEKQVPISQLGPARMIFFGKVLYCHLESESDLLLNHIEWRSEFVSAKSLRKVRCHSTVRSMAP